MPILSKIAAVAALTLAVPALASNPNGGTRYFSQIYWGAVVPDAYNDLMYFENHTAERSVAVQMWSQDWTSDIDTDLMRAVRQHGSIPMLSWQPYLSRSEEKTLNQIYTGLHDEYIEESAELVKSFGHPVFIRLGHDMNGNWFPWAERANGNAPGDYVKMWKHVVDLFRENGANNTNWVWCPYVNHEGSEMLEDLYPGDDYVDWTCIDGYNSNEKWSSFYELFKETYDQVTYIAQSKPVYIAETASTHNGGDKAQWIQDMLIQHLPNDFPMVMGFNWYNVKSEENQWHVESSEESHAAFKSSINSGYYASNWYGDIEGKIEPLGRLPRPNSMYARKFRGGPMFEHGAHKHN
jgi:hypothetical protein